MTSKFLPLVGAVAAYAPSFAVSATAAVAAAPATSPASRPALTDNVLDARGLDYAVEKLKAPMRETDPLPPGESLRRFKPRPGLAVDLVAAEPVVRQPLCLNFDERGRMWVVQYVQYPFPAGLKVVEYDKFIRAKFDKVPPAPPRQIPGHDVVTILEDVDRDGSFRSAKTFVDGLSIATSALPGRGGRGPGDHGVWVMNAPYLLFYPDANRDDVPDGDPIVHLSGFGIEDTHAVASNLTWGPDGWLYGCQGSTCTAKVKVELSGSDKTTNFLGQAVWRYHPETHRFEIFAEGGGNTFGLEFDDAGNAFTGTNWGKYRGLHLVQGGYYVKGWGKHGPLTNPYAFGYFEHMPHEGNADRLAHTFVVYGGGLLGPEYDGKIISPNSLQSRLQVTQLKRDGSTFKTAEEPFLVTTDDGWFRPVDLKAGPDGAIYVADFYERRISHVDPRDTWDRTNGRIWRVRPAGWKPKSVAMDLAAEPAGKLVERLDSPNRWERSTARLVLGERGAKEVVPALRKRLEDTRLHNRDGVPSPDNGRSLDVLWTLFALGEANDETLVAALDRFRPDVVRWAVRLAGDKAGTSPSAGVLAEMLHLAEQSTNPHVRSQLASTARRIAPRDGLDIVKAMVEADLAADREDPHIPLLLWWAMEANAVPHRDLVVPAQADPWLWRTKLGDAVLLPRLARRYAAEPSPENQASLVRLLDAAPGDAVRGLLLAGAKEAFGGADLAPLSPALLAWFKRSGDVELALRAGDSSAAAAALGVAADEKEDKVRRVRLIGALGHAGESTGPALLTIARTTKQKDVRRAAIAALPRFESPALADGLVGLYPKLGTDADLKSATVAALLARPAWAAALARAVAAGTIPKADVGPADVERLRQFDDPAVAPLVEQAFGKAVRATGAEKLREVERVKRLVTTGVGDAAAGKALFAARCAACHTLFGEGGKVGPDLTGYDRRNVNDMVTNVVDPSAYIREEFAAFRVKTKAGEAYVGLIVERAGDRLTVADAAGQRTTVARADVADERALTTSLMPEGLLDGLRDQEVRDLYRYLSADAAAAAVPARP
jgi:putative heme-binding domain-containing protein